MRHLLNAVAAAVVTTLVLAATPGLASEYTWSGALGDNNWEDDSNWFGPAGYPSAATDVADLATDNPPDVHLAGSVDIEAVRQNGAAAANLDILLTGTLGLTENSNFDATVSNSGSLNIHFNYTTVNGTLTNQASGSIDSAGALDNYGTVDNYGTLSTTGPGVLLNQATGNFTNCQTVQLLNSGATGFENYGTADNQGTITAPGCRIETDGTFNNSGLVETGYDLVNLSPGVLNNLATGTIEISGLMDNTGELYNDGVINNLAGAQTRNQNFWQNDGSLTNAAGATFTDKTGVQNYGTVENDGLMTLDSGASFWNKPGATFDNRATLDVKRDLYNEGSFTNSGTTTITGSGRIENNGAMSNSGMIDVGVVSGDLYNYSGRTLHNLATGTIQVGLMSANSGLINNEGTLTILGGAEFDNEGTIDNHGTLNNDGIIDIWTGGELNNYGLLTGKGTVEGDLTSTGDVAPGTSAGWMTVNGTYTQEAAGTLLIELGGIGIFQYDMLHVDVANLHGGTLSVSIINGFTPLAGHSFDILNWNSRTGTFDTESLPGLGAGLGWDTSDLYTTGTLRVVATQPPVVPEPTGLGLIGLALLARRRRR